MLVGGWGNKGSDTLLLTGVVNTLGNGPNKTQQASPLSSLPLLSDITAVQQPLIFELSVLERYCSCHPFLFVWSISHGLVDECTWCPAGGTVWGGYITYGTWGLAGRCKSVRAGHFWMGSSSLPIYCDVEKITLSVPTITDKMSPAITPFPPWWIMPSETVSPSKLFPP